MLLNDRTFFDVAAENPKSFFQTRVNVPPRSLEQREERLNKAREMFMRNPKMVHVRNNLGDTPLIVSILSSEKEMVRLLLEYGADANETGQDDSSPLELAIKRNGNPEIVSMLLEHGADPYYTNRHGQTLLMSAGGYFPADYRYPDPQADPEANFRRMLDFTQDINQLNHAGGTALHSIDQAAFIPLLCARGAELNIRDNSGKAPLHYYVEVGCQETVALVKTFLRYGPDVNVQDNDGCTPLYYASCVDGPDEEVVSLLLAAGADPNFHDKKWGYTPLHLAVMTHYWEIIPQLVEAGADVNLRDKEGRTPLKRLLDYDYDLAARFGHGDERIEAYLRRAGAHP